MATFDPTLSPLAGVHVVEASAGTGKTYSLGLLYLRALLERGCTPAQILVLTFSRAAAQDLKTRIYQMLEAALQFDPESRDEDSGLQQLLLHLHSVLGDALLPRLRAAHGAFDLAQISTIHAWCLRVLNEHALGLGLTPGQRSLVQDSSAEEALERSTRLQRLAQLPPAHGFANHDEALRTLRTVNKSIALRLLPEPAAGDMAWQQFSSIWQSVDAEALEKDVAWVFEWRRRSGFKVAMTVEALQLAHSALRALQQSPSAIDPVQLTQLQTLHIAHLDEHQVKRSREDLTVKIPALTALAPALDALATAIAARRAQAMRALDAEVMQQQQRRLVDDNTLDFDAAVNLLARALQTNAALARSLAQLWPVALIDEFQDTDQTQYAIFRAMYLHRSDALLYLIGDPKQAIYRFRDGDVFAYLKAQEDAASVAAMAVNYRSDERYVAAINQLYHSSPLTAALGYPDTIRYQPMRAHKAAGIGFSGVDWVAPSDPPDLQRQVVDQVHALLASGECMPDDLAILCKSNHQVDALAGALRRRGIPLRTVARGSLFEHEELQFILDLLPALAGDRRAWNQFVLLGPMPVTDAASAIHAAEPLYVWARASFDRLGTSATLLQLSRQLQPMLAMSGSFGRRVRSALRQTAEWLAALEVDRHDIAAQLKALREASGQIDALRERRCDTLAAVQLMTVHQAKGLEFNVVLLPYAFRGNRKDKATVAVFHDPAASLALTLDFGSRNFVAHHQLALAEAEGDDFRLLYVALTRAVSRTLIFVDCNQHSKNAALTQLLLGEAHSGAGLQSSLAQRLQALIDLSADTMRWTPSLPSTLAQLPTVAAPVTPPMLPLARSLPRWRWSSFSGLKRSNLHPRPPTIVGVAPVPTAAGLRGALFGECVHQLLETLDFANAQANENLQQDIERAFGEFALPVSAENTALTQSLLLRAAQVPLPALGCALAGISPIDLVRELKFTVLQPEPADVGGLQVPRGALTGFVDLMIRRNGRYFVLDFKTNDVGADAASYAPVTLLEDVRSNGYDVQGLMYARALLKRLRLAEPTTSASHIGGALVVYLRGLDANSPGQGVVHLRFKEQDLND